MKIIVSIIAVLWLVGIVLMINAMNNAPIYEEDDESENRS